MLRPQTAVLLALVACTSSQKTPSPQTGPTTTSCSKNLSTDTTLHNDADVTEKPILRSHPPLMYPRTALRDGITGLVVLSVVVNANGSTDRGSIQVAHSLRLDVDSAAIRMLIGALFWPACRGAEAVRAQTEVPVSFSISIQRD